MRPFVFLPSSSFPNKNSWNLLDLNNKLPAIPTIAVLNKPLGKNKLPIKPGPPDKLTNPPTPNPIAPAANPTGNHFLTLSKNPLLVCF